MYIVYFYFFTSPMGVILGAVELAPRLRTRVSHRVGLLFETFRLFKIIFQAMS
jgi:hypothetical protein